MKKIFSYIIVLILLLPSFSVYAAPGDILYANKGDVKVQSDNGHTIALLQAGYVVADLGVYKNGFVKVLLTDGKKGYVDINSLAQDYSNLNKIVGNVGEVRYNNTPLMEIASEGSRIIAKLNSNDKIEFTHTNYINNKWARGYVVTGKSIGKTGYIDRKNLNVYNFNTKRNNIKEFILFSRESMAKISENNGGSALSNSNSNNTQTTTKIVIKDTHIKYIRYLKSDFPIKYRAFLNNLHQLRLKDEKQYLSTLKYIQKADFDIFQDIVTYKINSNSITLNKPNSDIFYSNFSKPKPVISDSDIDYLRNLQITSQNGYDEYINRLDDLKITDNERYLKIINYLFDNAPDLLSEEMLDSFDSSASSNILEPVSPRKPVAPTEPTPPTEPLNSTELNFGSIMNILTH